MHISISVSGLFYPTQGSPLPFCPAVASGGKGGSSQAWLLWVREWGISKLEAGIQNLTDLLSPRLWAPSTGISWI